MSNNNIKVTMSEDDLFCVRIKNAEDSIHFFNKEYLEEYGIDIPKELYERYLKNLKEYKQLQSEIYKYFK